MKNICLVVHELFEAGEEVNQDSFRRAAFHEALRSRLWAKQRHLSLKQPLLLVKDAKGNLGMKPA